MGGDLRGSSEVGGPLCVPLGEFCGWAYCVLVRAVKRYGLPPMRIHKYAGPYMCTGELSTPGTKGGDLESGTPCLSDKDKHAAPN
jgi:hypothetical protein